MATEPKVPKDRSHWRSVVVRPDSDLAALEAWIDGPESSSAADRIALAWQLSVEAGRLAGWSDDERRLPRSAWLLVRR
jgi:hypothetical protein